MRSVFVKGSELLEAAKKGIVVMGDSVHAGPILGGYGANAAVKDGVEMAEQIIANGTEGLSEFYEPRYENWRKYVDMSERQLAEMHGKVQPNL
jgi:2-polyprenyl-6-methoxyphenol hydroxylase-like FAD-dependent oxidoreductase